jgi:hypothetical protein
MTGFRRCWIDQVIKHFREGFETFDLKEAKTLLDELASRDPRDKTRGT